MSFGAYMEALEDCLRTCKAASAAELRGRRHSGFSGAGYHDASYLYGYARALVAAAGGKPELVPDYRIVREAGARAAREEFIALIRDDQDPFKPLTPRASR